MTGLPGSLPDRGSGAKFRISRSPEGVGEATGHPKHQKRSLGNVSGLYRSFRTVADRPNPDTDSEFADLTILDKFCQPQVRTSLGATVVTSGGK